MAIIKEKIKEILISLNKMEKLGKESGRKYLSVPALNKMNNETYIDGKPLFSGSILGSSNSVNSSESLKGQRRKSFMSVFSLSGSSSNEKAESAPTKLVDIDIHQRTSYSSFFQVHHDRKGSARSDKFSRDESERISGNTSFMTQAHSLSRGPADPDGSAGAPLMTKNVEASELIHTSCSSKARQKKFHRHFKQVDIDEKVLNYYSCALVGDILLQGHLYITENFFAFYSNVFGYVTKLLIPTVDVLKISKEKTAKIIPNAVGISTEDEKHVFGSLLSRDSTYKFMLEVWKAANSTNLVANITSPPIIKTEIPSDEDSSGSSANEEPTSYISTAASSESFKKLLPSIKRKSILMTSMEVDNSKCYWNTFKDKIILTISLTLLVLLFGSAGYLLYRIAIIQNHFNDLSLTSRGSDMYEDIIKWQSKLHSSSTNKIYEFLNTNLNQIIKIRLSLEALSMLILPTKNNDNNYNENSNQNSKWDSRNVKKSENKIAVEGN